MRFSLLHKCVAYLLSGLGLVALSLGSELSETVIALVFLGYVGSWFAEEKLIQRPQYGSLWNAAVVLCLGVQLARGVLNGPTLAMAIEFAAFLQLSRLWNRRTGVDYQQIAVLAFLHLIAATVLSTNLSYAALFVGFVIATPWMLALSHLRREIEGNYPAEADADPNARVALRRVLASRRVVGPRFLVGTALLSVPLFAMTLAIFIMVPRVGQGFLSFQRDSGQRVAGFGNQVELGGFGVIRDDPTVVLRVMPQPRVDEKAPRLSLRLRGTSFDRYDGRRWTRAPHQSERMDRIPPNTYPVRRPPMPGDKQLDIVLDHLEEPVVFLPEGVVALSIPTRAAGDRSVPRRLSYSAGLDVRYERPDGLGLMYTAYVSRDPSEADLPSVGDERRAAYLQVPEGHEKIVELAQQVAGDAASDRQKVERIDRFLKSGQYAYSLAQPEVTADRLPLEVFLFEQKRGHCEYYSSAMAIMARALGVPARNVTGFVGGQYNPYGGYYALRQGDAHSWVEVFLENRGWVTYDPTPASRAAIGPRQNLWSDVNALVDALRTRWMTSIVGYDLRTQVGMLRNLAAFMQGFRRERGDTADERDKGRDGSARELGPLLRWGAGALLLSVFAWFALRLLRSMQQPDARPRTRQQAQVASLYGELERVLARRGHPRPPAVTPLEHARALSEQKFPEHSEVDLVTRTYVEARYGERSLAPAELAELRKAIARIRRPAA